MSLGIVTVIQARTASTRLPRKVLLRLGDCTVLDVMIQRVRQAQLCGTVCVATTMDPADDAIEAVARHAGVACIRGDPTDLLDRHYIAASAFGAEHVVKIPSDCPLVDPDVIDTVIDWYLARADRVDYASNLHPATYPDGNDVEIMSYEALSAAWSEARQPFEREHTTPFIWNRPRRFRLGNVIRQGVDCSLTHRVVLDYPEDYVVIRAAYDALRLNPAFTSDDVIRFLDDNPLIAAQNADRRGSAWYNGLADELPGLHGASRDTGTVHVA